MRSETSIGGGSGEFPATRWTRIVASRGDPEAKRKALEELLAAYWKPLYFYARCKGRDPEAAKDAVQGFCAHLLGRDFLAGLDPAKGRLRAYLKTAFSRFLINEHERSTASKRGGEVRTFSLDFDAAERSGRADSGDPESAFDREWALAAMDRALAALREEQAEAGREAEFRAVEAFFSGAADPSYAEVAARHGFSVPKLKSLLHRAREQYRQILLREAADTLDDPAEAGAEIEALLKAVRS